MYETTVSCLFIFQISFAFIFLRYSFSLLRCLHLFFARSSLFSLPLLLNGTRKEIKILARTCCFSTPSAWKTFARFAHTHTPKAFYKDVIRLLCDAYWIFQFIATSLYSHILPFEYTKAPISASECSSVHKNWSFRWKRCIRIHVIWDIQYGNVFVADFSFFSSSVVVVQFFLFSINNNEMLRLRLISLCAFYQHFQFIILFVCFSQLLIEWRAQNSVVDCKQSSEQYSICVCVFFLQFTFFAPCARDFNAWRTDG